MGIMKQRQLWEHDITAEAVAYLVAEIDDATTWPATHEQIVERMSHSGRIEVRSDLGWIHWDVPADEREVIEEAIADGLERGYYRRADRYAGKGYRPVTGWRRMVEDASEDW